MKSVCTEEANALHGHRFWGASRLRGACSYGVVLGVHGHD